MNAINIDILKDGFASEIKYITFEGKNTFTRFDTLFQENFENTIEYFKNRCVSALDLINKFKNQDWIVQWAVNKRLAESFDVDEYEEDFTDEAHKAIDNIFTKEAMYDICEQNEFKDCYFQC